MTAVAISRPRTWGIERDDEGYRTFMVSHVVRAAITDGPLDILLASGLPTVGSAWTLGGTNDPYCYCTPYAKVSILQEREGDPATRYRVDQKFTNKPMKRCQDTQIEDPLMEPQEISGSFTKFTEEKAFDRFGNMNCNSAWELFKGPQVEFDANRPQVVIKQNVADLELPLLASMIDTVNDATLWGLGARKVKLSDGPWERKYQGVCSVYFTRTLTFDINFNGWDKTPLDEGTKVLNGHWSSPAAGTGSGSGASEWILDDINGEAPDKNNPQHFIRYKDRNGENTRVILDGSGIPLSDSGTPVYRTIEYYPESNFLLLGIPSSIGA